MAVNKFKRYPLYAKGIIFLYTIGYLTMMIYHIFEVVNLGFFSRNTPLIINIWYDALGFLIVPLTIVMLYAMPKRGLGISLAVMMLTFVFDALVRYVIQDDSYANWFYYFEISFAIFVLATYPVMRIMVKPKNSDKQYA
jgi:hypothetical protein